MGVAYTSKASRLLIVNGMEFDLMQIPVAVKFLDWYCIEVPRLLSGGLGNRYSN